MSKAYDHLECDFLEHLLLKMGFCIWWLTQIMKCVPSKRFNILMVGKKVAEVTPSRGLRQGDPLCHYLFIMEVDVLS